MTLELLDEDEDKLCIICINKKANYMAGINLLLIKLNIK